MNKSSYSAGYWEGFSVGLLLGLQVSCFMVLLRSAHAEETTVQANATFREVAQVVVPTSKTIVGANWHTQPGIYFFPADCEAQVNNDVFRHGIRVICK